jgi:predicted short-subunit dehydrogenase-like oxidoreductase (DUF2520 family)
VTASKDGNLQLRFSLAGPGKVGLSLAHWLLACGGELVGVAARRLEAAEEAATTLGAGRPTLLADLDSSGQDLLLVAVSDAALVEVAHELGERPQARVVLHPSGVLGVETLDPIRKGGSAIGGLHPLRAFPDASHRLEEAGESVFGIGGDPAATSMAQRLARACEAETVELTDDSRATYHLAASLAAGGVMTLLATADQLATNAGLSRSVVRGYLQLAHQALDQAERGLDPAAVITGPVARGDTETLALHLAALATQSPKITELLVALSRATLEQRERVGMAPEEAAEIRSILANSMERKSFLDRK